LVSEHGKKWVEVRTGVRAGELIEVFGELHAGDEVARHATDQLHAGTEVPSRLATNAVRLFP